MTGSKIKKNTIRYYVIVIVCLFLMFFGGIIPPFASEITELGMQILCIFIGMVVLWSTVGGIVWPSILGVIALGLTEYTTVGAAITSAIGQSTLWQIMMCIVLASAIAQSGAGEVIARWALSRKFVKGRPYLFSFIYLFIFWLIAAVSNPLGMILLGWTVLEGVASVLKQDLAKTYFRCMSVFTVVVCSIGDLIIPFKTWLTALWNAFGEMMGSDLSFVPYLIIVLSFGFVTELMMVLFIKIVKMDVSFLRDFDTAAIAKGKTKMNGRQIAYLVAMLISIIIGLSGYIMPEGSLLRNVSTTLTMAGVFSVAVALLAMFKGKDGKPLLDFKKTMAPGAYWGSFFIVAAAIPLASALISEGTGFPEWLTNVLTPIFESSSILGIYLVLMISTTLLTNVASNAGVGMMLLPLAMPIAEAAGASKFIAGICVIVSACLGLMTPGGSAAAALIYGNRDQLKVSVKDIAGYSAVFIVFYFILGGIMYPVLDSFFK